MTSYTIEEVGRHAREIQSERMRIWDGCSFKSDECGWCKLLSMFVLVYRFGSRSNANLAWSGFGGVCWSALVGAGVEHAEGCTEFRKTAALQA